MPKIVPLITLKLFWQYVYYFCATFMKIIGHPFLDFLKDKMHLLSTKVFANCKIFIYWNEKKTFLFYVSPKNSFLEPNLIQKPTKNQSCHP